MHTLLSSETGPRVAGVRLRQAALAVALLLLAACKVQPTKPTPPDKPDAAATPIAPADLPARIRQAGNGPVVVNFWATWCQPCIEEMPELTRFYNENSGRGISFLSISVDSPDTVKAGKVDAFVREHKLPFPVYVLTDNDPEAVAKALGIEFTAVPITLLYAPDGRLLKSWQGAITHDDLTKAIQK